MRGISIANKLEVIGEDTLVVPGCEPESSVTSVTLSRFRRCNSATVRLADALAAIPGSYIVYQMNMAASTGVRRKWFVLPPFYPGCPCNWMPDYYGILRAIRTEAEEDTDNPCNALPQGFCPPAGFNQIAPPPVNPYQEEGQFYGMNPDSLSVPRDFSQPDLVPFVG